MGESGTRGGPLQIKREKGDGGHVETYSKYKFFPKGGNQKNEGGGREGKKTFK